MSTFPETKLPRCFTRTGTTLIEVVAGLALMGTLLTVVMIGSTQHARQAKAADRKRLAVQKLDRLLGEWSLQGYPTKGLDRAAAKAGLTLLRRDGEKNTTKPTSDAGPFRVSMIRRNSESIESASVIRLEVEFHGPAQSAQSVTWAEVMVPRD